MNDILEKALANTYTEAATFKKELKPKLKVEDFCLSHQSKLLNQNATTTFRGALWSNVRNSLL